jgi:hypothetical protein
MIDKYTPQTVRTLPLELAQDPHTIWIFNDK